MKQADQDKLRDIFSQIKSDSPSMSFENNLMQRIRIAHQAAERKRKRWAMLSMVVGLLSMIVLPALVLHLLGWSIVDVLTNENVSYWNSFSTMRINPTVLSVSIVCFVLLIVDLFVRRYFNNKEEHK